MTAAVELPVSAEDLAASVDWILAEEAKPAADRWYRQDPESEADARRGSTLGGSVGPVSTVE